jgi:hypothetical protein
MTDQPEISEAVERVAQAFAKIVDRLEAHENLWRRFVHDVLDDRRVLH